MSAPLPQVFISARAARRLRDGHVWVFETDIRDRGQAEAGDIVLVSQLSKTGGTSHLGIGFYNPRSMIALRLITRKTPEPDRAFFRAGIESALAFRRQIGFLGGEHSACRLVFSEADMLPGLIADYYDGVLVLQTLCAGADRLLDLWVDLFSELLSPRAIVERNDTNSRKLEGLEFRSGLLRGQFDGTVEIREGSLRLLVDPLAGQKTGSFLDQRENRIQAGQYARGRCLDVFGYQGGFGLELCRGGASDVLVVDQSERSLEVCAATARLNGLNVRTQAANAFDFLREIQAEGQRFDVIVLDPPAFAKNREAVPRAERGYKEINLRAMKLLEPGGVLITSSCSYHMREAQFEELLMQAGLDAGRTLQVLERRSQSRDHPERLGFPESRYLKCFVLRVI